MATSKPTPPSKDTYSPLVSPVEPTTNVDAELAEVSVVSVAETSQERTKWSYLKDIFSLAWQNSLTSLIQFSISLSATIFLGRLDSVYLGAAALANMFCNITGFSVGLGMCTAMDTLCSQAYGAKKYPLVGLWAQRGIVITTLLCFPLAIMWWYTESVFLVLGMSASTSSLAAVYCRYMIIGMAPWFWFEVLRKYLQGQGVVWPIVTSAFIATLMNVVTAYLLIFHYKFGFTGAAISNALANWYMVGIISVLIAVRQRRLRKQHAHFEENAEELRAAGEEVPATTLAPADTWPPLSMDILRGWGEFFRLGIGGCGGMFVEWGSYELSAFLSGKLGETLLAVQSVFMSSASLFYMIPIGLAVSTTTRIGNALGAGKARDARNFAIVGLIVCAVYGAINGFIFTILMRNVYPKMFTSDNEVLSAASEYLPVMWLYGFFDATKCVCMAIMRGLGRQSHTVWGNSLSCLLVGLPLSYALGFPGGLKLLGIWVGMSMAWCCATIVYSLLIFRFTDWEFEVRKAAERTNRVAVGQAPIVSTDTEVELAAASPLAITIASITNSVMSGESEPQNSSPRRRSSDTTGSTTLEVTDEPATGVFSGASSSSTPSTNFSIDDSEESDTGISDRERSLLLHSLQQAASVVVPSA